LTHYSRLQYEMSSPYTAESMGGRGLIVMRYKFAVTSVILVALMMISSGGAGTLVDPAVLLTRADAEAVMGTPVKDSTVTTNPMGQKILHYSPVTEGTKVRYVQISVNQTAAMPDRMTRNGMSAPKLFEDSARLLGAVQQVSGFGDKAFWGGSGLKAGAGLHVLKGDVYLSIDVALGNEQADRQAAEGLAKQALSRM
jgi:hypothetical protein